MTVAIASAVGQTTADHVGAGKPRLRMLVSYHYFKTKDLDTLMPQFFTQPWPEVFLDSGAWSAFTQGVDVSIREYIEFVRRFRHWFTVYSNLDNMLSPDATWRNQQIMEDAGLSPLPVFHTGEPWSFLERYIDRYVYIALGKIIPFTNAPRAIVPWVLRAFRLAGGRSRYHGFGVTNWTLLETFPWYSVDSSSWGTGFRFGAIALFDPRLGRFRRINLGDHKSCYRERHLLDWYGFHPTDFANRSKNDRTKIMALSALAYHAAEKWLRKRHGPIPMIDDPTRAVDAPNIKPNEGIAGPGLRLYMADTVPRNLAVADAAIKQWRAA